MCFDVSQSVDKAPVILYNCHGMLGNQHFKYNPVSSMLRLVAEMPFFLIFQEFLIFPEIKILGENPRTLILIAVMQ